MAGATPSTTASAPIPITGAPQIAGKVVVIGNGGAEYDSRGYVTAYDLETGKQAWRFYTVPGDPAKPFENKAHGDGGEDLAWHRLWKYGGGGNAWDAFNYDPELNLVYFGTANGAPWNRALRSPGGGDNLFLASIVALNADTGEYAWHYQTTPGERWDYDATPHLMLATLKIDGADRKVLMQASKNGFFYVLDRKTGELLPADKFVDVNWADGVDPKTGRPMENAKLADYGDGKPRAGVPVRRRRPQLQSHVAEREDRPGVHPDGARRHGAGCRPEESRATLPGRIDTPACRSGSPTAGGIRSRCRRRCGRWPIRSS